MTERDIYLGDGLYAKFNGYTIEVYASPNGITRTNEVFLEPQVLQSLIDFAKHYGWNIQ